MPHQLGIELGQAGLATVVEDQHSVYHVDIVIWWGMMSISAGSDLDLILIACLMVEGRSAGEPHYSESQFT